LQNRDQFRLASGGLQELAAQNGEAQSGTDSTKANDQRVIDWI